MESGPCTAQKRVFDMAMVQDNGQTARLPGAVSKKHRLKGSSLCKTPPRFIRSQDLLKEFQRGNFIGEGGFARCFQVEDKQGQIYAAKTVAKASLRNPKAKSKLLGEIEVHKSLDHPHVVKFIDCFEDDLNIYMILEMCNNQSLMDALKRRKRFSEPEVRYYLLQILGALKYLHSRKIIHRDLKLGNIFLDKDLNVKVGDFGLAAILLSDSDRKRTICGTPNYIAPEVLFSKDAGHSFEVDIWSAGVIMYALLIGKPPFQADQVDNVYKRIKANKFYFPEDKPISPAARDLICSLLKSDPSHRPSLNEIANHRFFHNTIPRSLPPSALDDVPNLVHLTAAVSRENYLAILKAAGIGNNVQSVSSNEGTPVHLKAALKVPAASQSRLIPESLSPRSNKDKYKPITGMPRAATVRRPATQNRPIGLFEQRNGRNVLTSPHKDANFIRNVSSESDFPLKHTEQPSTGVTIKVTEDAKSASGTTITSSKSASRISKHPTINDNCWNENVDPRGPAPQAECEPRLGPENGSCQETTEENFLSSLRLIIENIKDALNGNHYPLRQSGISTRSPFISKWVDYTNKYGFGYQLSDGSTGVYFNDATSLLMSPNERYYEYITAVEAETLQRIPYPYTDYPNELDKKVFLTRHFNTYMTDNLYKAEEWTYMDTAKDSNMIAMTHYHRTKQAILFRLSSKEIQINFLDHCKLILSEDGTFVRFIDRKKHLNLWSVSEAILNDKHADREKDQIRRRLKFAVVHLNEWIQARLCDAA